MSKEEKNQKSEDVKALAQTIKELVRAEISAVATPKHSKKGSMYSEKVKGMKKTEKTAEFIKALITNQVNKLDVLSEGTAGDGGYLVPEQWANEIVEDLRDATVIRQRATVLTISGNKLNLPTLSARPKVYWRSELAAKSSSSVQFDELELTPYSLAVIISLSQELVDDATVGLGNAGLVTYVTNLVVQSIAEEEDAVFASGSGSGRPTGIDTYTASFKSIDAADAVTAAKLINLTYKLGQAYRNRAVWIMNTRTLSVVMGLLDGNNRPIFVPSPNDQIPSTILGRPVLEQNDLSSDNIFFGDLSKYYIVQRQGITTKVSDEATVSGESAFEKNLVHVRVEERVDGELADVKAFVYMSNTGIA